MHFITIVSDEKRMIVKKLFLATSTWPFSQSFIDTLLKLFFAGEKVFDNLSSRLTKARLNPVYITDKWFHSCSPISRRPRPYPLVSKKLFKVLVFISYWKTIVSLCISNVVFHIRWKQKYQIRIKIYNLLHHKDLTAIEMLWFLSLRYIAIPIIF